MIDSTEELTPKSFVHESDYTGQFFCVCVCADNATEKIGIYGFYYFLTPNLSLHPVQAAGLQFELTISFAMVLYFIM